MTLEAGQLGATNLLAKLLASFDEAFDPEGAGIGADVIGGIPNGVKAEIQLPSGDRYRIAIEWLGDNESEV